MRWNYYRAAFSKQYIFISVCLGGGGGWGEETLGDTGFLIESGRHLVQHSSK